MSNQLDEYQNTVIRFPKGRRNEDDSVEIGIERSYVYAGGYGEQERHAKTGPWVVVVKNGSIISTGYIPADAARRVADAICRHADECDRRNNPQPPEPEPEPELEQSRDGQDAPDGPPPETLREDGTSPDAVE